MAEVSVRTCVHCGCTDEHACFGADEHGEEISCMWVTRSADGLTGECSFCVDVSAGEAEQLVNATLDPQLILPGDPDFHL